MAKIFQKQPNLVTLTQPSFCVKPSFAFSVNYFLSFPPKKCIPIRALLPFIISVIFLELSHVYLPINIVGKVQSAYV